MYLRVSDTHELWFEDSGSGDPPILFLHGGPGGGVRDVDRQLLEAHSGRVVLLDQRGAGKSRPKASLEENTTWHLVSDLERLREHLGIERWVVVGGSWGSTLALVYAISHPEAVLALIVHGVFLCNEHDLRWFYGADGAATLYPDEYERFTAPLSTSNPDAVIASYHEMLANGEESTRAMAASAWARWETVNSFLSPTDEQLAELTDPANAYPVTLIETAYFKNGGYMEENHILNNAAEIVHLPCRIVQGRYDTICPMRSAWALHRSLPNSAFEIVDKAAHDIAEPALHEALAVAIGDVESLVARNSSS